MFSRLQDRLRSYRDNPDPLAVVANTVALVIAGMVAFGESTSASRLACIALILAGVAGLRLTANP